MTRVYVGMSGGVDSSVAAALLVEQGFSVTGVYMKNWTEDLPGMKCPWAEDLADAKRVAVQLGIDFKVFDFEREYKQRVVDYMIDEYKAGRTPNPDIMCNQEVKFKLFLEAALDDGADMIATGHYARVSRTTEPATFSEPVVSRHAVSPVDSLRPAELAALRQSSFGQESTDVTAGLAKGSSKAAGSVLCCAVDTDKDQTYFLYRVTSEALAKTLFPLGDYTKSQVREMAKSRGLWTAQKKESMGVCFVGAVGMRDFLSQYVSARPGDIIEKSTGKKLGRHDGAIYYTLGQRHGLDIGGGLPYYVVGKDMQVNEVYVSTNLNDDAMWRKELELTDVHWIADAPSQQDTLSVRLRHRGALLPCTLRGNTLQLHDTERAPTAGQSAVFYRGNVCLGGGIVIE